MGKMYNGKLGTEKMTTKMSCQWQMQFLEQTQPTCLLFPLNLGWQTPVTTRIVQYTWATAIQGVPFQASSVVLPVSMLTQDAGVPDGQDIMAQEFAKACDVFSRIFSLDMKSSSALLL